MLEYKKAITRSLRELGFDERWLQERILEDPSILGLGDLNVIERERTQPTGGRIDFLMYDPEEDGLRYEIEVMLGKLDESHIIRTIEYWDVEQKRFPSLEHRAVIVAEDITNRFFNVIALLTRAVPITVLQYNAFEMDGSVVLNFTKVLDAYESAPDEEQGIAEQVDRAYWEKKANPNSLSVVDKIVPLVPTEHGQPRVTYNKYHIAVGTGGRNFAWFHPRKSASHCYMHMLLDGEARSEVVQQLEDVGIFAGPRGSKYMKMRITQKELTGNGELVHDILCRCEANSRK